MERRLLSDFGSDIKMPYLITPKLLAFAKSYFQFRKRNAP
ncbi:hypothetical protein GARC_2381 [Paraglaciecola arctica BSs20135]|uniref:Uncharacterized protein n=1 Tax=Paraglaciecola arctica BSs20135 TaxID=493475 RepID=K6YMF7_9ALTE|nr:hypothetical protein GARC_2381 [Paraglaciecola arctica BSs20135]